LTGNININTSWVIFSGNPDYHHDYDNTPETLARKAENPAGFIRLLDES
jgi:hypothetical protein